MFKDAVGESVIGNGLGVTSELGLVKGMGDGATGLLSSEDEVGSALFVFAANLSDEESAEGIAAGDPAQASQLSGELLIPDLNGFCACCFHMVLEVISIITDNIRPCNTFLQLLTPALRDWPPFASVSPNKPHGSSSNSLKKVCQRNLSKQNRNPTRRRPESASLPTPSPFGPF